MAQFKLFSKLPAELRVTIWDAAIRDNSPAAHFFTTYHNGFDPNFTVDPESRVPDTPDTPGRYRHIWEFGPSRTYRFGLAAPHNCPDSEYYSWVDGNPSAYMTDSGIWTACWESRERMIHYFHHPNRASSPVAGPLDRRGRLVSDDAPVTLPFRRDDNGERQQLTVRPSEDLICLQFAKGPAQYWCLRRNLPTFRRPRPGGGVGWEVTTPRHVAVEFDQLFPETRVPQLEIAYPCGRDYYGDAAFQLAGFWFIARTLERRYRTDEDRSGRRTFRAAGGMELVEVRRGDDEWWDRSLGPDASDGRWPYRSRAEDLAEQLHRVVLTDKTEESIDDSADERLPERRFGVLACVTPGSEKHLPTKREWMHGFRQQVEPPEDETWYWEV